MLQALTPLRCQRIVGAMTRRRSAIASTRSSMYSFAKLLGDVRAVQTGTVPRRVKNRIVGRSLSRLFR